MNLILKTIHQTEFETLGNLFLFESGRIVAMVKTLELPWLKNKPGASCIPAGTYNVKVHNSPRFGWSLWLHDVPGRSEILIHAGNFTREIRGCILPGAYHTDMDNDGVIDVKHSKVAIETLKNYIKEDLIITVRRINQN